MKTFNQLLNELIDSDILAEAAERETSQTHYNKWKAAVRKGNERKAKFHASGYKALTGHDIETGIHAKQDATKK